MALHATKVRVPVDSAQLGCSRCKCRRAHLLAQLACGTSLPMLSLVGFRVKHDAAKMSIPILRYPKVSLMVQYLGLTCFLSDQARLMFSKVLV